MEYYYLSATGETVGPLPEKGIRGLRQAGVITDATMTAASGSETWLPYAALFPPAAKSRMPVLFLILGGIAFLAFGLIALMAVGYFVYGRSQKVPPSSGEVASNKVPNAAPAKPIGPPSPQPIQEPPARPNLPVLVKSGDVSPVAPPPAEPAVVQAPKPKVAEPIDPLAEWYDFGYNAGKIAKKNLKAFGQEAVATRAQLFQLIKNLGVEASGIGDNEMGSCLSGYKDALAGLDASKRVTKDQASSFLPERLRGFNKFPESLAMDDSNDFAAPARASTVMILAKLDEGLGQGSGFFVAPGIIVTNRHVVEGARQLLVLMPDKSQVAAEVIKESTAIDAAVIAIKRTDHPVLAFAYSQDVKTGSMACAVGFPESFSLAKFSGSLDKGAAMLNLSPTSTYGRIGGRQLFEATKCLHLDLNINHGNSGGPVVDQNSQVVGISTYGLGDLKIQGLNYAIEADLVKQFVLESVPGINLN
ncbi:S1C family serine protease [Verrucomicrobium sp. BvORR106]|uniref:S1C family serine protease n=1 Tax=Verrucomicrobium sp. BvORR106 TaxID=1403819 RepID=UPI0005712500|nr:S1C family serine protease [Verrucomicrobium sp. BvORR106]